MVTSVTQPTVAGLLSGKDKTVNFTAQETAKLTFLQKAYQVLFAPIFGDMKCIKDAKTRDEMPAKIKAQAQNINTFFVQVKGKTKLDMVVQKQLNGVALTSHGESDGTVSNTETIVKHIKKIAKQTVELAQACGQDETAVASYIEAVKDIMTQSCEDISKTPFATLVGQDFLIDSFVLALTQAMVKGKSGVQVAAKLGSFIGTMQKALKPFGMSEEIVELRILKTVAKLVDLSGFEAHINAFSEAAAKAKIAELQKAPKEALEQSLKRLGELRGNIDKDTGEYDNRGLLDKAWNEYMRARIDIALKKSSIAVPGTVPADDVTFLKFVREPANVDALRHGEERLERILKNPALNFSVVDRTDLKKAARYLQGDEEVIAGLEEIKDRLKSAYDALNNEQVKLVGEREPGKGMIAKALVNAEGVVTGYDVTADSTIGTQFAAFSKAGSTVEAEFKAEREKSLRTFALLTTFVQIKLANADLEKEEKEALAKKALAGIRETAEAAEKEASTATKDLGEVMRGVIKKRVEEVKAKVKAEASA